MKTRHYDWACDVDQPLFDRLRRFPREPNMLVYGVRALVALIIRSWLRIYHRFEIIGHENLRTNRSLVIVANHSSHLDTLCLLAALPGRSGGHECAPLCATSSRSPEPLHLFGTSQQSRKYPDHLPGRHAIEN